MVLHLSARAHQGYRPQSQRHLISFPLNTATICWLNLTDAGSPPSNPSSGLCVTPFHAYSEFQRPAHLVPSLGLCLFVFFGQDTF